MGDPVVDATAFARAATARHKTSAAMAMCGIGLAGCLAITYVVCTAGIGDARLTAAYRAEVEPMAYIVPLISFSTAFLLNFLLLAFERGSVKFQLAMVACYINFLAGLSDYLSLKDQVPVLRDAWNQGFVLTRAVMWLFTTPSMVYLLSMVSDFNKQRVYTVMVVDFVMISLGIAAQTVPTRALSVLMYILATSCFAYVIGNMWQMFEASLLEARNDGSRLSLSVLRVLTIGLWFTFPIIFVAAKAGLLSLNTEEWLWSMADFAGKVMFSSSLLQGNFLTIEQRRLIAMRIVEEGNRVQVIQELKNLVEQKERFMSGMSHELRTPLNGIIGLSDALVVGSCGPINEAATKTITTIKTSGSRLLNLINDILDAASMRQMHGKLTIKHEKVNLLHVVDDVVELCAPLAKRGVELVNTVPADLPYVLGDTGRIIQIFHNLIGNACKFTHQGSITISATNKVDEVEISISDTGIGIPEDKFESIFLAFEQVDMSTTRKYGGTGLGLNLVKQLVEAHNGTISVKSKLGRGTTFYWTIKVYEEGTVAHVPDAGSRTSSTRNSRSQDPHVGTASSTASASHAGLMATIAPAISAVAAAVAPKSGKSQKSVSRTPSVLNLGKPRTSGGFAGPVAISPAAPRAPPAVVAEAASAVIAAHASANPDETLTARIQRYGEVLAKAPSLVAGPPLAGPMKVKVLSVDDDPINQMVVQNLLTPVGISVVQAMDGQEALDILENDPVLPDVILLDVMMPGMSGYEVVRKLRETYPWSCIPVIMISAKSKEENIVEGLTSGSNDYLVKPFGRQEIMARISAHLRFRDRVYQAGELAGSLESSSTGEDSIDLGPMLAVEGRGLSLPPAICAEIDKGRGTSLKMYDQLTLLMLRVANIEALSNQLLPQELTKALAALHIAMDELVEHNAGYLADDGIQGNLVVITGLNKESDQVDRAMGVARGVLLAMQGVRLSSGLVLEFAMAIHSMPVQSVIVGVDRPVMHLTGELPTSTGILLGACPSNCVHLSSRAVSAMQGDKNQVVRAATVRGEATYLMTIGSYREELPSMESRCQAFHSASPLPHIVTTARKLKPMQRALMELVLHNPSMVLELWNSQATAGATSRRSRELSRVPAVQQVVAQLKEVDPQLTQRVDKLARENAMLTKQLDEVSEEAGRLQDQVDALQGQVADAQKEKAQAQAAVAAAQASHAAALAAVTAAAEAKAQVANTQELQAHETQVAELEAQLAAADARLSVMQKQLTETERKLGATQAALLSAHEQQSLLVAGVRAEAEASLTALRAHLGSTARAMQQVSHLRSSMTGSVASTAVPHAMPSLAHTHPASPSTGRSDRDRENPSPIALAPHSHAQHVGFLDAAAPGGAGAPTGWAISPLFAASSAGGRNSPATSLTRPMRGMQDALAGVPEGLAAGGGRDAVEAVYAAPVSAMDLAVAPQLPGLRPARRQQAAQSESWNAVMPAPVASSPGGSRATLSRAATQGTFSTPGSGGNHAAMRLASQLGTLSASKPAVPTLQLSPEATADIQVLLEELGLPELVPRFQEEEVTPALLPFLEEEVLRDMGVTSMGARLKLKLAVRALEGGSN